MLAFYYSGNKLPISSRESEKCQLYIEISILHMLSIVILIIW